MVGTVLIAMGVALILVGMVGFARRLRQR